jgi:hypothetical protein
MGLSTCGLVFFGVERGFWRDFLNVGAGGWRKRLRIVWEFFQSHASLEVSLIIFSGLL